MLTIIVGQQELWDNEKSEFYYSEDGLVLELEHSLASLSKWESKHKKPFLGKDEKTVEEVLSYVECMIMTPDFPKDVVSQFSEYNLQQATDYIGEEMTATWFRDNPNAPKSNEIITNELIYYWMMSAGISIECQHWHLSRLFTLIKIFSLKSAKPKPMSRSEIARRNRELNAQRRAQLGTKG